MSASEFLQRLSLVSSQRVDVMLACLVFGVAMEVTFQLGRVMGSDIAFFHYPNYILVFIAATIWAPLICYVAFVHTVERALLERSDKQNLIPIVRFFPSVTLTCTICYELISSELFAHHPAGHAVSQANLDKCSVFHQSCLLPWWRNDRTKAGQCPECTIAPQWSRIVLSSC